MSREYGGIELNSTSTAEVSSWNVLLYIFFGYIMRQPIINQKTKQITSRYLSYDKTGNRNVQLVLQHCCQNSDVARFTTHKSKLPFNKSGCCKTRNIAIQLGDVTLDDSQRRFSRKHSVAMLEQCCNYSKQCRNNVATLCCAKNRHCESSRVTSPLERATLDSSGMDKPLALWVSINLVEDTFLIQSELLSVDFLGDGKARVLRVKLTSLSNRENQQQTQPTFRAKARIRTQATSVVHSPLRRPSLLCICTRQRCYLLQFCGNLEAKMGYFRFLFFLLIMMFFSFVWKKWSSSSFCGQ